MRADLPPDSPPPADAPPSAAPASSAPVQRPAASRRRPWLRLQQKTTILLLTLLIAMVAAVGSIFLLFSRSMLQDSRRQQVSTFAYGLSATLAKSTTNSHGVGDELTQLGKTPNLQFVVLSDAYNRTLSAFIADRAAWDEYRTHLNAPEGHAAGNLGRVRDILNSETPAYGITVPVFTTDGPGGRLFGYLHTSFDARDELAQLRFLQALVLLTCIGGVLLSVPVASLISRHISVPIQRLAHGAHALADGDLDHRVSLPRGDELGELADAFNRMADTVQDQQAAIRRINSGLEQKVLERTYALEEVNRRLQAEISEKEDFLRAVSHDLNAPLRNIAGMASMLALKYQDTLEKDALQRLDRIQKNVQVECELINELLELSRIKSRREKIERVDLHELVTAVVEGFDNDFESKGITFRLLSHLPTMNCEKMRMRQIFQNLIDNAIKYMRLDGPKEIRLSFDWQDGDAHFVVEDTGMGIAKEDLPNLFHVFRRAKNANVMKVPGKGVGLASVKSIVENYHGRLWAQSQEGQGTTFHFTIPGSHFEAQKEVAV